LNDDETRRRASSPLLTADDFRPLSARVQVELGARSHRGTTRTHNEDHYLIVRLSREQETIATSLTSADLPGHFEEQAYAMLVADGLGETGAGSLAGRVALSTIAHLVLHHGKWTLRVNPQTAAELLERAAWYYERADEAIVERSQRSPVLEHMATALTAVYSAGNALIVAHVGHSRAYLFRDGSLTQLTRDHTVERHLTANGRPVAVERRGQDLRHILTDAVGANGDRPVVDVEQFSLTDGDAVLLCTNGLTDMVSEQRIADVLSDRRQAGEQCQMLVDLALAAGGQDNVTVLLAQYHIPPL
jgi:protein phosphatase